MAAKHKSDPHLTTAHVLFMDVVGYSKLLVNEQREVVHQLNQIVRKTAQFRTSEASGKLISIPSGDGMALVFFQSPEEPVQCALEISRVLKIIRVCVCAWVCTVGRSIRLRMSTRGRM